jgi:hypothetical protein
LAYDCITTRRAWPGLPGEAIEARPSPAPEPCLTVSAMSSPSLCSCIVSSGVCDEPSRWWVGRWRAGDEYGFGDVPPTRVEVDISDRSEPSLLPNCLLLSSAAMSAPDSSLQPSPEQPLAVSCRVAFQSCSIAQRMEQRKGSKECRLSDSEFENIKDS